MCFCFFCVRCSRTKNRMLIKCKKKEKKKKKYHSVGTVQNSNRKITQRYTIETPNTQLHDRSLSYIRTGTSRKAGLN